MNELVPFERSALPQALYGQVRRIVVLGNEASVAYVPGAESWLADRRATATPGSRKACHAWVRAVIQGVNGVTPALAESRETAIWAMCNGLPAFVWCQATVRDMWAKTCFLPTPGEASEVLRACASPLHQEIEALEKIVAAPRYYVAPPVRETRAEPSPEDCAHVAELVAAFVAERPSKPRPKAKALHLTADQLSQVYRELGSIDPRRNLILEG